MSGHDDFGPSSSLQTDSDYTDTKPAGETDLRGVISDDVVQAIADRNEARRRAAIKHLGTKYLLHPMHRVRPQHRHGVLK